MIEKIVLDHLLSYGVRAYMEDPAGSVAFPYYIIQKTSGGKTEHISRAMIAIQSYGSTMFEAASANEFLKTMMESLIEDNRVARVSLNSDYQYTDTRTKKYRYQAVFDIVHY